MALASCTDCLNELEEKSVVELGTTEMDLVQLDMAALALVIGIKATINRIIHKLKSKCGVCFIV